MRDKKATSEGWTLSNDIQQGDSVYWNTPTLEHRQRKVKQPLDAIMGDAVPRATSSDTPAPGKEKEKAGEAGERLPTKRAKVSGNRCSHCGKVLQSHAALASHQKACEGEEEPRRVESGQYGWCSRENWTGKRGTTRASREPAEAVDPSMVAAVAVASGAPDSFVQPLPSMLSLGQRGWATIGEKVKVTALDADGKSGVYDATVLQRAKGLFKVIYDTNEWDWVHKNQINCHLLPPPKAKPKSKTNKPVIDEQRATISVEDMLKGRMAVWHVGDSNVEALQKGPSQTISKHMVQEHLGKVAAARESQATRRGPSKAKEVLETPKCSAAVSSALETSHKSVELDFVLIETTPSAVMTMPTTSV